MVEDYPDRFRGPSVLTLQYDGNGRPFHVVWALPAIERRPAVLVTAYRPDPKAWDNDFRRAEDSMTRKSIKLIHEGKYAAEIPIDLIYSEESWSPTMSLDDARKLDAVRLALRRGDIAAAAKHGRVFELTPVAVK